MPASIPKQTSRDGLVATGGSSNEICWGELTILEFPNILGDNPGVSEGVPLSIGWKPTSESSVDVDLYEFMRQNRPRRKRKELVIKSGARDTL